jgi:bifunctional enzyme CysN/CysC
MNTANRLPDSSAPPRKGKRSEQMDVVIVGHVDHGKSTVIGRLMADTGSLPEGKLEAVRARCKANARPFEYAFLLDALKNEQAQGITIDTARCFFRTQKRYYIIHDAPGHVEFLKNMVTGAARAEAALLVIDAHEGIQENSRRHGYILSMLGIGQVTVLVNKMDLVGYDNAVYDRVQREYSEFLASLGVRAESFIPVSAREGENIAVRSENMPWYPGLTVLEQVDAFEKRHGESDRSFRLPVQDVYKFTAEGDDRRIIAGTIETGSLRVGDELLFLPSRKRSRVAGIEGFNSQPPDQVGAGQAVGLTLETQIYIQRGELAVRSDQPAARIGSRLRANIFWMGHAPMIRGKRYKLKIGAARVPVSLAEIHNVLDASELSTIAGKDQIDRHDVGEVVLETARPVAFDLSSELERTSRFVIVDNYEVAACGIVLEEAGEGKSLLAEEVERRELRWSTGYISPEERLARFGHAGKFIIFVGEPGSGAAELAKKLELKLFLEKSHTYYLTPDSVGLDATAEDEVLARDEHLHRLGELARVMTDAGLLFITALDGLDEHDLRRLKLLNAPNELFVVGVGEYSLGDFVPQVSLPSHPKVRESIDEIARALISSGVLLDYQI